MCELILVKHAAPAIEPTRPSRSWVLSAVGRRQSELLAARLAPRRATRIYSSDEPKAVETAELIGAQLETPPVVWPGLHENDRSDLPFYADERDYEECLAAFFTEPHRRVIGRESADEAHERFYCAVSAIVARIQNGPVIVVTHGTVMTLFVARANSIDPYTLWSELRFTSFVVLSSSSFEMRQIVHPEGSR